MSLVSAVVAARKAMEPLVVDKKAKAGVYSFKYASLLALLDVVVPALAEQGVLLVQDVHGDKSTATVQTYLYGDENEKLYSEPLSLGHNGTAQEMGKCITTLRRYQLMAFMGLAAEDDDAAAPGSEPIKGQPQTQQRAAPVLAGEAGQGATGTQGATSGRPVQVGPVATSPQASLDLLRMAARKGQGSGGGSPELQALVYRVRNEDAKDSPELSTTIAEGKKVSIYTYMAATVIGNVVEKANAEQVLSYMYGRVISNEYPPKENTRFLFDEVMAGEHKKVLGEVRTRLLQ